MNQIALERYFLFGMLFYRCCEPRTNCSEEREDWGSNSRVSIATICTSNDFDSPLWIFLNMPLLHERFDDLRNSILATHTKCDCEISERWRVATLCLEFSDVVEHSSLMRCEGHRK